MTTELEKLLAQAKQSSDAMKAGAIEAINRLTDPAQKAFFSDVLSQAEKGNFNIESFLNEAKKFQ